MSIRPIHMLGAPALRERSAEVGTVDEATRQLVADLFETMKAASGVGLAANQVGLTTRVAVVEADPGDQLVLIDPVITSREGKERDEEGCLSIPDIFGDVDRAVRITVETTTLAGEREVVEAADLKARVIQHEIDHLDGVLFIDHLSPLKRRLLLQKWKRLRRGKQGYIEDVAAGKS